MACLPNAIFQHNIGTLHPPPLTHPPPHTPSPQPVAGLEALVQIVYAVFSYFLLFHGPALLFELCDVALCSVESIAFAVLPPFGNYLLLDIFKCFNQRASQRGVDGIDMIGFADFGL